MTKNRSTRESVRAALRKPGARGAIAIGFVMIIVGVLLVMGLSGSFQVSGSRKILEKMYARRLQLMIADSAFEEASAHLENLYPYIPFLSADQILNTPRDLKTEIINLQDDNGSSLPPWPTEYDPTATRGIYEKNFDDGAHDDGKGNSFTGISPVRLRISPWILKLHDQKVKDNEHYTIVLQEVGIVEMSVSIAVHAGSSVLGGTVIARRYLDAKGETGQNHARLRVHPRNMVLRFPSLDL